MSKRHSKDWHNATIVYRLKMRGVSLRQLSKSHGFSPTALSVALQRPWPKAEGIIAAAIGVSPESIWPNRYAKRTAKRARIAGRKCAKANTLNALNAGCTDGNNNAVTAAMCK